MRAIAFHYLFWTELCLWIIMIINDESEECERKRLCPYKVYPGIRFRNLIILGLKTFSKMHRLYSGKQEYDCFLLGLFNDNFSTE
jgi:hypothetical protein